MEIAVGVLLAVAGLALVGLVAALAARRRSAPDDRGDDDLPGFLESPPGSAPRPAATRDAVVALAAPPAAPPPRSPRPTPLVAVLSGLVVLLLAAAAVVALAGGRDGRPGEEHRSRATAAPEAHLRFGGVVLDERAVGVTVGYPVLVLEPGPDGPVATLELPIWNCLTAEAPEDPADAGCVRSRTEHAELRSPALAVSARGDRLAVTGDFRTSTRPAGGDPEPTGRTYAVAVRVRPDAPASADGWAPAAGRIELDGRRAGVVEGELRLRD